MLAVELVLVVQGLIPGSIIPAVLPQVLISNEEQRRAVEAAIAAEACFLEALVSSSQYFKQPRCMAIFEAQTVRGP